MAQIKNKHIVSTLISSLFALCTFIVLPASAGLYGAEIQQEDEANDPDIERIQVVGERPRIYFRREMIKAEDNFYDLYNQLTPNDDFKVRCEKVFRAGSHIKNRVCKPNFTKTIRANMYAGSLAEMTSTAYNQEVDFRIKKMQEEHYKSMEKTVNNNPKLKELLLSFHSKRKALLDSKVLDSDDDD